MGILGRMRAISRRGLGELFDTSDEPERALNRIVREMEDLLDRSRTDTARVVADARRLERETDAKAETVKVWSCRAEQAVQRSEEGLARKALERKRLHEEELGLLQAQLEKTREAVDRMKSTSRALKERLAEARARHASLRARNTAARSGRDIQDRAASVQRGDRLGVNLEEYDRRVQAIEAETVAVGCQDADTDPTEREFSLREREQAIDDELAALKAKRDARKD
jgi:phage shock protein A